MGYFSDIPVLTRAPTSADRLDINNPLTDRIVLCTANTGSCFTDVANGNAVTKQANAAARHSRFGGGLYSDATLASSGLEIATTRTLPIRDSITVLSVFVANHSSTATASASFETLMDATTSNTNGVRCFAYTNLKQFRFRLFTGSATNLDATPNAYDEGDLVVAVYRYDGATMSIWQDGVKLASTAKTGNISAGFSKYIIGQAYSNAAAESANANILISSVWARGLSDAEVKSISANPWQIFKPSFPMFVNTASGGGTNIAASCHNLVLTTFPATINAAKNIAASRHALTLTTFAATVSTSSDVNINAGVANLTLTTHAATINFGVTINANVASLLLTTHAATINAARNITATCHELTLTTLPATVELVTHGTNIQCGVHNLTLTTFRSTISGVNVDPTVRSRGRGFICNIGRGMS